MSLRGRLASRAEELIVLDTDVLSELARPAPDPRVVDWVDVQDVADLVVTAITAAEIRAGVALLPDGRRRRQIEGRMEHLLSDVFGGQVLVFDGESSRHYAAIVAARTRAGRPIGALDAQIGAVCLQFDATLATRNTPDFEGIGLRIVDPWAV